jgi:RNA polymerase sigma-70 factor (ECF subfamily)
MTDETILQLARQPHTREEGLRQLVLAYQERLYQHVRRQVSSHGDADDVLQNTFLKIFRHLNGFEGRSELFTWMYRIAQNEVINHHRKLSKTKWVDLESTFRPGSGTEAKADEYVSMDHVPEKLEAAVNKLPERQKMVFRMRYYDELSYKQMAEILQLTEGALKASFHHAVRKIEDEFRSGQMS